MSSDGWILLQLLGGLAPLALGVAVFAALRLLSDPREPHSDSLHLAMSVTAWVLIIAGLLALLGAFAGPVGFVVGAVVITMAAHRARRTQQYALVSLLAATAERMMPLVPAIDAYAREYRGTMGRRAAVLADHLRAGVPLPDALDACRGAVPREAVPLIRTGYDSGALAAALREAAAMRHSGDTVWDQVLGRTAYLGLVLIMLVGVLTFIMLKIIPAMEKIFVDFGAELPAMTVVAVNLAYAFIHYWFLLFPLILPIMILAVDAILRYVGWTLWRVPGTGWMSRRLDTAAVLDGLSLVAARRYPMPAGMASLAKSFPVAAVRTKLWQVVQDLEAGADWAESLRRHGLICEVELAVIASAQRAGNLPWALRELADSNRRRWAYRALVWLQILFPVVILGIGLVVALYVIGCFLPLVALIQNLT